MKLKIAAICLVLAAAVSFAVRAPAQMAATRGNSSPGGMSAADVALKEMI